MSSIPPASNHKKGIGPEYIKEWIPGEDLCGLKVLQAQAIISNYFCGTIITRGVCPIDCQVCKREVIDLFRLKEAKKPTALLTWLSKDHAAKWIEKLIERQKREEYFPSPESPTAPASEREAFDQLFPDRKPKGNLFTDLEKDYEG